MDHAPRRLELNRQEAQPGLIPCIGWLRRYQKDWLRPDVMAGLTAAAVVIPKAMAYATIAGLPVQVGLYTAFLPMLIYAVLGTSRPLSVSTTTTIAILTGALLGQVVPGGDPASLHERFGHADAAGRGPSWCWLRSCGWGSSPTSSPNRC